MTEQEPTELVGVVPATQPLANWSDLVLALGGDVTSFTGRLLELVQHADPGNRERLRLAFPREVLAWEIWVWCAPAITAGDLRQQLEDDSLTADVAPNSAEAADYQAFVELDDPDDDPWGTSPQGSQSS